MALGINGMGRIATIHDPANANVAAGAPERAPAE